MTNETNTTKARLVEWNILGERQATVFITDAGVLTCIRNLLDSGREFKVTNVTMDRFTGRIVRPEVANAQA